MAKQPVVQSTLTRLWDSPSVAQRLARLEHTVRKTLIATCLAFVIGCPSVPCFADGHVVNGYAASPAELQTPAANAVRAALPPDHASITAPTIAQTAGQKCYYVLDVLLCD